MEIVFTNLTSPLSLNGIAFNYYCQIEKSIKTHKFEIWPPNTCLEYEGNSRIRGLKKILKDEKFSFIHHYRGNCQSCEKGFVDYLLRVQSFDKISIAKQHSILIQ